MNETKHCPNCGGQLRLYDVAVSQIRGFEIWKYILESALFFLIVGVVGLVIASWGVAGEIIAFVVAFALVASVFYKSRRHQREKDISEHGRYHCDKCGHHFEGDGLRQLTTS